MSNDISTQSKVATCPSERGWKLFNENMRLVTNEASSNFIEAIRKDLNDGYGFVPLVGAGFSASAGVPLVRQLKAYLHRCICVALAAETLEDDEVQPWNPRTDRWPPFTDRTRPEPISWEKKVKQQYAKRKRDGKNNKERMVDSQNPATPSSQYQDAEVFQEAFGAMAEWRTSLLFLSRLMHEPARWKKGETVRYSLGPPRQEIIDACFREVMRDKHPSLNHSMLAALSGLLRIDVLLTTNFDDLLERAFRKSRNPLEVFEVHLGGHMPDWSAVSRERTLVKLHGSRYSLRADYSLDGPPSISDRHTFAEYLAGERIPTDEEAKPSEGSQRTRNRLIVLGVSARERRTRDFIEYAWNKLPDLKVYWVCHGQDQVDEVRKFTTSYCERERRRDSQISEQPQLSQRSTPLATQADRSLILRHTEVGLLLLHLYQTIRRTVPPNGTIFPSASRIPLPPLPSAPWLRAQKAKAEKVDEVQEEKVSASGHFTTRVKAALDLFKPTHNADYDKFWLPDPRRHKLVVVAADARVHGVTSACGEVFREMQRENVCLWIDMNDVSSADNLFEVILESGYYSLGQENWTPVYMGGEGRPRAREIRRLADSGNQPWIIFLNARETPGSNRRNFHARSITDTRPNGWLDQDSEPVWEKIVGVDHGDLEGLVRAEDRSGWAEPFMDLLTDLCGRSASRVSVVLLCCDQQSHIARTLKMRAYVEEVICLKTTSTEALQSLREDNVAAKAIQWACAEVALRRSETDKVDDSTPAARQRFLQTIVLMQRSRLLATIWDSCVCSRESDPAAFDHVKQQWLDALEDFGLLRWKSGGYIWLHARYRQRIREYLRGGGQDATTRDKIVRWNPERWEAEVHERIAQWYIKILDATQVAAAVFEAIDHLCFATESLLLGEPTGYILRCHMCLDTALLLLERHAFVIQTHGYSRGSCRRLVFLRDFWDGKQELLLREDSKDPRLLRKVFALKLKAVEVMRAIAREVGEDKKAYQRHAEWRKLILAGPLATSPVLDSPGASFIKRDHSGEQGHGWTSHQLATTLADRPAEWMRWWRWCAMLGISSRSFKSAESALSKALYVATTGIVAFRPEGEYCHLASDALPVIREMIRSGIRLVEVSVDVQLETIRALELSVVLLLLRESAARRRVFGSSFAYNTEQSSVLLDTAEELGKLGLAISERVRASYNSAGGKVSREAAWCKSRFLMHLSLVANDRRLNNQPTYYPMSYLSDAQTCLTSVPSRYGADLALIELHRAEVRLQQGGRAMPEGEAGGTGLNFSQRCHAFLSRSETSPFVEKSRANMEAHWTELVTLHFKSDGHEMMIRRIKAHTADALRFLDRAEPILRERRRNVWWTTWYFERRLRVIAYSVWASLLEIGSPIPYLGLEATMRRTETEADTLLDDAIRMIRVDGYRLAAIIEAYALCLRGLQVRLFLDAETVPLPGRLRGMQQNLNNALNELQHVRLRRDEARKPKEEDRDEDVTGYIEEVVALAALVVQSL